MRRFLVAALAVALTLAMLALVMGCGGGSADKDTAKQYMNDGDTNWQAASNEWDNINNMQAQITSQVMSGDVSILQGTAGQDLMAKFQASFDTITADDKAAQEQYSAILQLNGVQDYQDYATQMLNVIDLDQQRVMAWEAFTQKLAGMVTAGGALDIQQLASDPDLQHITDLASQIDSAEKEAESIKSSKKL
jgi:hypothetical protein